MARSGRASAASRSVSVIKRTRLPLGATRSRRPRAGPGRKHSHVSWQNLLLDFPAELALLLRLLQWQRLDFTMQRQQQTNWCWTAVATSVSLFYNPASTWTQCSVANQELGRTDCCTDGSSAACNVPASETKALTIVGNLGQHLFTAATYQQVIAQVMGGGPLGVRIVWNGSNGQLAHILAIAAYNDFLGMIGVEDPLFGSHDIPFGTFPADYQTTGATWVETYLTSA